MFYRLPLSLFTQVTRYPVPVDSFFETPVCTVNPQNGADSDRTHFPTLHAGGEAYLCTRVTILVSLCTVLRWRVCRVLVVTVATHNLPISMVRVLLSNLWISSKTACAFYACHRSLFPNCYSVVRCKLRAVILIALDGVSSAFRVISLSCVRIPCP